MQHPPILLPRPPSDLVLRRYSSAEEGLDLALADSHKYSLLLEDIRGLQEMFTDLHDMVRQQQPGVDMIEDCAERVKVLVVEAEKELKVGEGYQTGSSRLKIVAVLVVGSALGASGGGAALLLGVKPILGIAFGGGFGVLLAGVWSGLS